MPLEWMERKCTHSNENDERAEWTPSEPIKEGKKRSH